MRYGTGLVEKVIDGRNCIVRVRVAVDTPVHPEDSYIRCTDARHAEQWGAAACSGARFARRKAHHDCFKIDIKEISGDIEGPMGLDGVAVATTVATWIAYGVEWDDADLVDNYGWSVCHSANAY